MLVESMSFNQMRKQVLADIPVLAKKMKPHIDAILKVMRKTNLSRFGKFYEYITPQNKNRWLYKIESNGKIESTHVITLTYFHTSRGYAAILYNLTTKRIFYFTPHFFDRYCERKLDIKNIKQLLTTFIDENNRLIILPKGIIIEGRQNADVQIKHGMGLGSYHPEIDFVEMRTFINNNMLIGDQVEISYQVEKQFNIEIDRPKHKSLKERPYLYNIIYPLPHFLTELLHKGATRYNTALLKFL